MILREHKNSLLAVIEASDFDPKLFSAEYATISKDEFFSIQLRNSPLRFALRTTGSFDSFQLYQSTFEPEFPLVGPYGRYEIHTLCNELNKWLNTVVRRYLNELTSPDLWQALQDTLSESTSQIQPPFDLEPFSDEEKVQLKFAIDKLRLSIQNSFKLQTKQLDTVTKLLQHLSDAVDKHNRFDWRGIAISVAVTTALHLALNPDQTIQLFQLFKQAFINIVYLLP